MDFPQEKCPICYEPFNFSKKPYLLLICGHTFCNSCISQIKKECIEDNQKYISLSDFYHNQKKNSNLCDSQTSLFSDTCKKKSESSEKNDTESNHLSNLSDSNDSYIEIEEGDDFRNTEEKNEIENTDKANEIPFRNDNNEISFQDDNYVNDNDVDNESMSNEEEEEEDNESMDKNEEEEEEKNDSNDNSEKSINDINDIIAINDSKKDENNKKKIFKFRCPFCMFRIKITDKEMIINENILKINELSNDNKSIDEEKKYFCELCNDIVTNFSHYEKYGNEHNIYLFELNDNLFKRAFNNLSEFYNSKDKIISDTKNFLKKFNDKILNDTELIKDCKNNFEKNYKYHSKFMKVLKKAKKKLNNFEEEIIKKNEDKNNNNMKHDNKLKEEKELYERAKAFNQLISGVFFYPEIKMELIPYDSELTKIDSNIYLTYAIKESYNNYLQNGFFHFLRNNLFKTEVKYMPFYSPLTKRNFLFNTELNTNTELKISKIYSKSSYEATSDGHTIYFLYSKNDKASKFFSQNIHTKKIKNLPKIPLTDFKKLDTIMHNDSKLFVIGGLDKYDTAITDCCYYDIKLNKWENMPKLKYERSNKAIFIKGKELYTFGGKCPPKDSSYIFEKIDLIELKTWETFSIKNFVSNIYNFGFCMYSQDIIFIIGGEDQTTEDYIKKGYVLNIKDKKVIEEFNIDDVHQNNMHTPKCYRGIVLSTDKELINVDYFNVWKRLHKLNVNLP